MKKAPRYRAHIIGWTVGVGMLFIAAVVVLAVMVAHGDHSAAVEPCAAGIIAAVLLFQVIPLSVLGLMAVLGIEVAVFWAVDLTLRPERLTAK